jgi:hypothetical protein
LADISMKPMPRSQKSDLMPGENAELSGVYMNQPASGPGDTAGQHALAHWGVSLPLIKNGPTHTPGGAIDIRY